VNSNQIEVISGVTKLQHNLAGRTVKAIRDDLKLFMGIDASARPFIGGKEVSEDTVVQGGQSLEFAAKKSAEKGV
jgi:hypothetical protein